MKLDRTCRRAVRTGIVLLTFAALSSGAPIVIDDFNTNQQLTLTAGGSNPKHLGNNAGGASTAGGIGGNREFSITRTAGTGNTLLDANVNSPGFLSYSSPNNTNSQFLVVWDGSTNTTASSQADLDVINNLGMGLGNVDLTDGGVNLAFRIRGDADNNGNVPLILRIYTSATKYVQASTTLIGGAPATSYELLFSSFVGGGSGYGPGDTVTSVLSSANAIALFGNPPSASDVTIDFVGSVGTAVPEPGSLALIGSAIVALGFARRRRVS